MPHHQRNADHNKGDSLGLSAIELLIGLAVLAIIVLIAVPGSTMVLGHYRVKSVSSDLISSLYLARSEAVERASTVHVCPSDDRKSCRSDGDWSGGWLVYSDGNGDGKVQEIELLESFEAPQGHVRILASGAAQKGAGFTSTGLVRDNHAATGEFLVCSVDSNVKPKSILIDADGWVSMVPAHDSQPCGAG